MKKPVIQRLNEARFQINFIKREIDKIIEATDDKLIKKLLRELKGKI